MDTAGRNYPPDFEIHEQKAQKYAAIHIEKPFENPFAVIPNAYGIYAPERS